MSLGKLSSTFDKDVSQYVEVYEELATFKSFAAAGDFSCMDLCILEGALSGIWQAWCRFCRDLFIQSCLGTDQVSGKVIEPLTSAYSEAHVSAAAIAAWRKKKATWESTNLEIRLEPTWGDTDILLDIIAILGPSNAPALKGMCSMAGQSAKILQTTRNAAAHHHHQSLIKLNRLGGPYTTFAITHACQSLFWIEVASGNYLLSEAVNTLKTAVEFAI